MLTSLALEQALALFQAPRLAQPLAAELVAGSPARPGQ